MGLLDDAIREHLDLKRRRGADPAEIERAEREALGPVRRNRDTSQSDDPEALTDPADGEDAGLEYDEELGPENDALQEPRGQAPPGSAFDEPDEPVAGDLAEEDDPFAEDAGSEDAAQTRVMRATDIPIPSDATAEYDIAGALAADDARNGDDVGHADDARDAVRADVADADDAGDAPRAAPTDAAGPPPSTAAGEDVLEETPEFLQDTPDHDRLWFEQRPPRDFDFDS